MATDRYSLTNSILTDKERKNLAILDIIRRQGPIAKTEISRITEFNIVTVSNYVDGFIRKGLVVEKGLDVSTGGRRPLLVELNAKAGFVVGVGLTLFHEIAVVADFKGEVVYEIKRERTAQKDQSQVKSLLEVANEAIANCGIEREKIAEISVAIPGIIDPQARTIRWPGLLGAQDTLVNISLNDVFEKRFGRPTVVENDADAAVSGEKWFTLKQEIKDVLYMYSGVSCGIIINGQVYHGATGSAGELGIYNPGEAAQINWQEESVRLGRWEIDLGTAAAAREHLGKGARSKIFEIAENDPGKINFGIIVRAAKESDPLAVKILEDAGVKLGKKIAFLINLLNPEVVIIGGGIEQAGPTLLDSIKRTIKTWSLDEATSGLKIIPAQLGENAVPLGAVSIGIQDIFAKA